jgi:hypothetical protein
VLLVPRQPSLQVFKVIIEKGRSWQGYFTFQMANSSWSFGESRQDNKGDAEPQLSIDFQLLEMTKSLSGSIF